MSAFETPNKHEFNESTQESLKNQSEQREDIANETEKENTGIHEFVHLLDKEDGDVDGLPQTLLNRKYTTAWIQLVIENIKAINEGNSDINTYGATNKAEFFAVAAEYFFKRPDLFKERHESLYNMMVQIFNQSPPAPLFTEPD